MREVYDGEQMTLRFYVGVQGAGLVWSKTIDYTAEIEAIRKLRDTREEVKRRIESYLTANGYDRGAVQAIVNEVEKERG